MANYGLKYQTQFDGVDDAQTGSRGTYTLQFLFKNYSGGATTLIGGSTTFLQKCLGDDPFGIKGQSAEIRLLNYGPLPVRSFYSDEDDGIKVILTNQDGTTLFIGFVVQDDLNEPMVDYVHEISLTATDGLGLLRGVKLNDARAKIAYENTRIITNGSLDEILVSIIITSFNPKVGDGLSFLGNDYVITTVSNTPVTIGGNVYTFTLGVTPSIPSAIPATDTTVYWTGRIDLKARNSLITLVNACMQSTSLSLVSNIYGTVSEVRQDDTRSTLEQTYVDTQIYLAGDIYTDCYNVLESILKTFRFTLCQAYGEWNFVRFDELSINVSIPGFQYDESFTFVGNTVLPTAFSIGPSPQLTRPVASPLKGSQRGIKFTTKRFDYEQPKYLLRNFDFIELGDFIREFVSGGFTYKEYEAVDWQNSYNSPHITRRIRIKYDSLMYEQARYLVMTGPTGDDQRAVQAIPIEANKNDRVKFSFEFFTSNLSFTPSVNFVIMMYDGINRKYAHNDGTWQNTTGYSVTGLTGAANEWTSVNMETGPIPFDGTLYLYLPQMNKSPRSAGDETIISSVSLEYLYFINESTKIKGHIHKQERSQQVKNKIEDTLTIDDSPKNSINGTLFLPTFTGVIQDRTSQWRYGSNGVVFRLEEIMTTEEIVYRGLTRDKMDGAYLGVWQNQFISLVTPVITTFDPTKVFVFSSLTIDYKMNRVEAALLYEVTDNTVPPVSSTYTFNYIYK